MKPLVVMVTFNRPRETKATLAALKATTLPGEIDFVVVDNGSEDGTAELVGQRKDLLPEGAHVHLLGDNIGCPAALNLALFKHRQRGQPVVKIDNDVRLLTGRWVREIEQLVESRIADGFPVAMVSAYYPGVLASRQLGAVNQWRDRPLYHLLPIIGHCVWHTGEFIDTVGYFDVLSDVHLYGFEDLLLSHKASVMKWETLTWEGWQIENLQRKNSLGDRRDKHVARMRPLYNERVARLSATGNVRTGRDGQPIQTGG